MKAALFLALSTLLTVTTARAESPNCEPILQKQFAAIMNAQSGWKLKASDISVGSLVEGLYTVVAGPKVPQKGSEYLVSIYSEKDCRISSMVESKDETAAFDVTWKKGE